ncbi:MAG: hypothetical protein IKP74_04565 [Clostridia bacterium]|nr:hypothetical protein [Clostridia bacterium]
MRLHRVMCRAERDVMCGFAAITYHPVCGVDYILRAGRADYIPSATRTDYIHPRWG